MVKKNELKHIKGPEGVRGRNSENTLIKEVLNWAPNTQLKVGLRKTYDWIKQQIANERSRGSTEDFQKSIVVKQDEAFLDDFNFDV